MSTLSGIASKGEKGKSKFQSLDINSLYRGESLEPHQAKSTLPRKHGMQSLGKVPSARRPPANLPSLKSEYSGNDPAISLVPTGGTGWGNKPGETGPPATAAQQPQQQQQQQQQEQIPIVAAPLPVASPQAPVITQPVIPNVVPPTVTSPAPTQGPTHPVPIAVQQPPHTQQHSADKSWSSIMAGPGEAGVRPPSFLAHQSPQFQHEFPKLSSGDGQALTTGQKGGSDTQYGPGPSLRPQTEGSWIQGGGRTTATGGPMPPAAGSGAPQPAAGPAQGLPLGPDAVGGRNNLAPSVPQGGPMGLAGHQANMASGPIPHQFRGVLPQFMYTQRGNFPGGFPQNFPPGGPMSHGPPRQRFPYPPDARFMQPGRPNASNIPHEDEVIPRPIIKEEELSKMDDIARDPGWATHDDIDYNQKLAFSDDEDAHKEEVSRSQSHSSKEEKRSVERESRDSESSERELDNRRGENKRTGPTQDCRGVSQDQRDRSGPIDQRERSGPNDQRGWQQQQQQGRPMPQVDFRGGPTGPAAHQGQAPHQGAAHGGPPPVAAMRAPPNQGARVVEDEEIWRERRRQQSEEVAIAVERAKQRKEEEEKRYEESRQTAFQKLHKLEQKISARTSESKDHPDDSPSPVTTIPLPDWEKERESRERDRSRTSSEGKEDKAARDARDVAEFRQLTQVGNERSAFMRNDAPPNRAEGTAQQQPRTERDRDRDIRGDRDRERENRSERGHEQPVFSRQFQSNLPPRFQKQQAERTERHQFVRPGTGNTPPAGQTFDPRWGPNNNNSSNHGGQMFPGSAPTGGVNPSLKVGHMQPQRRNSETEREREPISERPPSRDQIQRDRRDRHPSDSHDNYRRDQRTFNEGGQRKPNYYEGQEYPRSYAREHDRNREEPGREWERDNRQYEEESKEIYDRHVEDMEPRRESEWRENKEWKQSEEREIKPNERPQRPDSRDSRASKESRNSRDSNREEKQSYELDHKFPLAKNDSGSWADSPFESQYDIKDDKKKGNDYYRSEERGRHAPGPITREKLEAAELRAEQKRNLTQLRRGTAGLSLIASDRKQDSKQGDLQTDKKDRQSNEPFHAWSQSTQQKSHADTGNNRAFDMSKSWADSLPDPEPPIKPLLLAEDKPKPLEDKKQTEKKEDVHSDNGEKSKSDSLKKLDSGNEAKKDDVGQQHRGRNDPSRSGNRQNWSGGYPVHRNYGGAPSRGRRGSERMAHPTGRRISSRNQDWIHGSESEYSGEEVSASTESGKEEVSRSAASTLIPRQDREPRSPKVAKKVEKDNRDVRREGEKGFQSSDARRYEKRGPGYDGSRGGRDGFAPRGEPSRRGRGGFRTQGNVSGRRMDGYGPPSSKSPFGSSHDEKLMKDSKDIQKTDDSSKEDLDGEIMNSDDKKKLKQQAMSAGIIGSGARQAGKLTITQVPPRMQRKSESERRDSSRSKGRGNRPGARDNSGRSQPRVGTVPKNNSSDHGEENWETTSENSDQDDRERRQEDGNARKAYPQRQREVQGSRRNLSNANSMPRSSRGSGPLGSLSNPSSRAPGAEKRSNNGYNQARDNRNAGQMIGIPSNGRTGPPNRATMPLIQRLDEIKIIDPQLVVKALAESARKKEAAAAAAARPEKDKTNALEGLDLNNYASVVIVDDQPEVTCEEERFPFDADNGFQEVRSKKNVKEARKVDEKVFQPPRTQSGSPVIGRSEKDRKPKPLLQEVRSQMTDPRREGVSMVGGSGPGNKMFERPRQSKLPPRLAKQRENNRLQKQQQQHGGIHNDVNEMNNINENISLFPIKDHGSMPPSVNAWDKPITALRTTSPGSNVGQGMQLGGITNSESCGNMDPNDQPHSGASSQRSTPNGEKGPGKLARDTADKSVLDGSTAPVQTIIFENTNYKSAPGDMAMKAKFGNHMKNQRLDKDGNDITLTYGNKGLSDIGKADKTDPDSVDMKLDFFDSELSQLTEDKKGMGLTRSMHNMAPGSGQNLISPSTADLNFKIASVKKVWEMPTVQEHSEDGNAVSSTASNYTPTFGNAVDMGLEQSFGKPGECQQEDNSSHNQGEVVYSHHPQHSPGPPVQVQNTYGGVVVSAVSNIDPTSTSSNVCKVKPQQQAVMSTGGHQGPLSPPPFNSSNPAPGGHMNYQATLGGGAGQFGGISAIPSPPTVLYNSSQQMPTQQGLYGAFQIDGSQVLGGQGRSQFSQFPTYGNLQSLGQTSAFTQQSMYLPTPHPPPSNAQDMYQSPLSQYRIQTAQGPFGQSQQLGNNPSTVLISSSANSLMSASVKPSPQQIGAIGTKGGVPYQTSSMTAAQQPSQMYIQYDPQVINQSYLSGSQIVQRSAVQNNVVPAIQPSSSYYSGSGGQGGFYPAGSSSTAGSPYGLQGYNNQSGNGALQNFSSQFLSSQLMQPPYRTTTLPAPPTYMKTVLSDHASNGRSQLKSPSNNDLQSVFSAGYPPQIPSPKSTRMNKQQPVQQQQQQSPTQQQQQQQQQQHQKFNYPSSVQLAYQQGVRSQMNMANRSVQQVMSQPPPRYPPPIQRPNVAYQVQQQQQQQQQQAGSNIMGSRHRPQHPATSRSANINKMQTYYGSHAGNLKMESNSEVKQEPNVHQGNETKMADSSTSNVPGNNSALPADHKMNADTGKDDSTSPATE